MAGWEGKIEWPAWAMGNANAQENIRDAVAILSRAGLQDIANVAASNTPFQHIADAYVVPQEVAGNSITTRIENDDPDWIWTEVDTKAHDIYPRNARALAWDTGGGTTAFAMHVHHPGTKGRHILEHAWDDGIDRALEGVAQGVGNVIETWGAIGVVGGAV